MSPYHGSSDISERRLKRNKVPLILFLLGFGLNLLTDIISPVPAKWAKYFNALLFIAVIRRKILKLRPPFVWYA